MGVSYAKINYTKTTSKALSPGWIHFTQTVTNMLHSIQKKKKTKLNYLLNKVSILFFKWLVTLRETLIIL